MNKNKHNVGDSSQLFLLYFKVPDLLQQTPSELWIYFLDMVVNERELRQANLKVCMLIRTENRSRSTVRDGSCVCFKCYHNFDILSGFKKF